MTDRSLLPSRRWSGTVALVLSPLVLYLLAGDWIEWFRIGDFSSVGMDFTLYRDATARWVAGGGFYEQYQLAAPYPVAHGAILYPPTFLLLMLPFGLLPTWLWWAIPICIVAATLVYHRPGPWAWLGIVLCLAFPATSIKVVHGNPLMWVVAALALGTIWSWPSVAVLIRPTLAPFALIGIQRRSWWVSLAGLTLVSLLFLPMWADYVQVLLHARDASGALYSVQDVPAMFIPLLAWLGGRHAPSFGTAHPRHAMTPDEPDAAGAGS